ncbi:MAG: RluA family pseudouridine synthase [Kiritimatiellales bacterium]|nr:RluA family pseudouridine synthase [Kiritimatiellales bacterium]
MQKIIVTSEYSDGHLVAVNKPAGVLTVPGRGPDKQDCLFARVCKRFPDALVVHRLDMGTSGLVLFARSAQTQRALGRLFEKREVSKTYIAVVEGVLPEDEGRIELPLRKDMEQRLPPKHLVDCVRGKQAVTRWRVLERLETRTRVELVPMTGRSHQLRVHMQSLGFPIAGDPIYGTPGARLMLHAETLAFCHPADAKPIQFECPVPF